MCEEYTLDWSQCKVFLVVNELVNKTLILVLFLSN